MIAAYLLKNCEKDRFGTRVAIVEIAEWLKFNGQASK